MAATGDHAVDLRRLYWVGPATVAGAVLVVEIMQLIAIALLNPSERSPLSSEEPIIFTAVLVSVAVVVFAIIGHDSVTPVRTFRRTAFATNGRYRRPRNGQRALTNAAPALVVTQSD